MPFSKTAQDTQTNVSKEKFIDKGRFRTSGNSLKLYRSIARMHFSSLDNREIQYRSSDAATCVCHNTNSETGLQQQQQHA
jgi:hypothetical protein